MSFYDLTSTNNIKLFCGSTLISFIPANNIIVNLNDTLDKIGIIDLSLNLTINEGTTKGVSVLLGQIGSPPSVSIITLAPDITNSDIGILEINSSGDLFYSPLNVTTLNPIVIHCHTVYIQTS